eukprot:symbB.v1.2.034909.t1/scaffold4586.1/size37666/3
MYKPFAIVLLFLLLRCVGTQDLEPFYLEVEDKDVGLLQPLAIDVEPLSNLLNSTGGIEDVRLEVEMRMPLAKTFARQAVLALTQNGQSVLRVLWSSQEESKIEQLGDKVLLILGSPPLALAAFCKLHLDISSWRKVDVSVDENKLASLQLITSKASNLLLHIGKAMQAEDVEFSGHFFQAVPSLSWLHHFDILTPQVKAWRGNAAPALHIHRPHACPSLHHSQSKWGELRSYTLQVLYCAFSTGCELSLAPGRYLLQRADDVVDQDVESFHEVSRQCPLGFAFATTVVFFMSYVDLDPDPVLAYGNIKLTSSFLDLTAPSRYEPMFAGTRPLRWLKFFGFHVRKRLRGIFNLPAEGSAPTSRSAFWISSGNRSNPFREKLASRLCIEIVHATDNLQILRNSVESLATAGVLRGVLLVIRLVNGCGGPWLDPKSPEGWYLSWLRHRFSSALACGAEVLEGGRRGRAFVLMLHSHWHLLPFSPANVWKKIAEAADILEGSHIAAVSLMEKFKHREVKNWEYSVYECVLVG